MRVMFTVFPAPAHFLPVVPLAWALQSAGHQVCIATPPGVATGVALPDFHRSVMAAGLTAVSCGDPEPLAVMDGGYPGLVPTLAESERYVRALAIDPVDYDSWDCFYHFLLVTVRNYHPPEPRQDVDAVITFARRWRPDLVLWEPWFPCGAVAARVCGAAHARVLNAPDYSAWAAERFAERGRQVGGGLPENPLAETIGPLARRHGCEVDEELLLGQWTVDPFPAGMRLPASTPRVPVRGVPYTGAGVMPEWLYERPDRPRVGLSLGVSAREYRKGDWGRTAKLLDAVADLDVEVVATLNRDQLLDVSGPIPDNVRTFDYLPLGQLLPTCSALIHHGAPGTFAAASASRVPQLVCDTDERPRFTSRVTERGVEIEILCEKQITATPVSRYVTERGAGVRLNHQTQSADEMRAQIVRVLTEPSLQKGAAAIHEDWLATPSPADIVPVLEELTARHRRGT